MIKVGLTGNIGSGKSMVCQAFAALGVPIFNADLEARKILNSTQLVQEIQDIFGRDVVNDTNEIDRKKLADIVFQAPEELEKLNQLIHPKLRKRFQAWCFENNKEPYVIQEAAILFENKFHIVMDKIITVSAPQELRMKRVLDRDGSQEMEVLARMNNQWPDGKKEALSDFVIKNDGTEMLLPQILKIHQELNS